MDVETPARTNREALDRFFATFHAHDMTAMMATLHPDFSVEEQPSLPYGGLWRGREGWAAFLAAFSSTLTDLVITNEFVLGEADSERFVLRARFQATVVATGARIDTTVLELYVIRDRLVYQIRPYYWNPEQFSAVPHGDATAR